jgi:hypothetical protein
MPPADHVQALERLVDEVERVSAVGEGPLGLGREQGVGERGWRETGGDPGEQGPLGRLAVADLRPAPQPALERGLFRPAFEGHAFPPRWLPVAKVYEAMLERATAKSPWEEAVAITL